MRNDPVEQLALSMRHISRVFGRPFKIPEQAHNVTPNRVSVASLEAATINVIRSLTAVTEFFTVG